MRRALAILFSAASLTTAGDLPFELDPARTTIQFTLGATLHTVHGTFVLKRSSVRFDSETRKISGELVIDAASGRTGNDDRDRTMHREILESTKYPEIVFAPDRVDGAVAKEGLSRIQMHGTVTLHGSLHEVLIPTAIEFARDSATVDAHFSIPYVDWGLKNPSNLLLHVRDHVEMNIHAVAHGASQPATGNAN